MKRLIYLLSITCTVILMGCFETTQETSIKKDGSGRFENTIDLSNMVALLKQMGGDEAKKMQNVDTSIALSTVADSITGLTPQQKKLVSQGELKLKLNLDEEKLVINMNFPFQKLSDVGMLQSSLSKISETVMKKLPGAGQVPSGAAEEDSSQAKSFDDFFDVSYTDKVISKTLNKEKYASAKDGQFMQSIKQMSDMGSPITANYVINLPRPAKAVEGKAAKLSEDKTRVTLNLTGDDFFSDPSKFEYKVEY